MVFTTAEIIPYLQDMFFTRAEMYPYLKNLNLGAGHGHGHGVASDGAMPVASDTAGSVASDTVGSVASDTVTVVSDSVAIVDPSLSSYSLARTFIMANWSVIGSIILPNVGGWVSGAYFAGQIRREGDKSWYDDLKKPTWNPPKWAFGPAWTVLYSGMGYASYLVWQDCGGFTESAVVPLTLYGTQLALNWAWTPIFFGLRDFKLAFIEITVLSAAATATAVSFASVNRTAGYLMVPYLGWLGLASSLTYWIMKNNPPKVTEIKDGKDK